MGSLVNVSANTFTTYHGYRDEQRLFMGTRSSPSPLMMMVKILKGSLHCITIRIVNVGYGADFVKIDEDSYALAYRTYNQSRWMAR